MKKRVPHRYQVKSACLNCRRKHAGCNNERPCSRCLKLGLTRSCADGDDKRTKKAKDRIKQEMMIKRALEKKPEESTEVNRPEALSTSREFLQESVLTDQGVMVRAIGKPPKEEFFVTIEPQAALEEEAEPIEELALPPRFYPPEAYPVRSHFPFPSREFAAMPFTIVEDLKSDAQPSPALPSALLLNDIPPPQSQPVPTNEQERDEDPLMLEWLEFCSPRQQSDAPASELPPLPLPVATEFSGEIPIDMSDPLEIAEFNSDISVREENGPREHQQKEQPPNFPRLSVGQFHFI